MVRLTRYLPALSAVVLLALPLISLPEEPGHTQCTATGNEISGLMRKTKVNAVFNYAGPDSGYKSDGDSDTLEMVFLPKTKGAISHVSDDGEVIFLYGDVRDEEQQQLITFAFCLRAVARRGLTTRSSGP